MKGGLLQEVVRVVRISSLEQRGATGLFACEKGAMVSGGLS